MPRAARARPLGNSPTPKILCLPNRRATPSGRILSSESLQARPFRRDGQVRAAKEYAMNEFQATAVMVALFALRCVLPLALMFAIGYGMNKLVDHWEKEEAAEKARVSIPVPVMQPVASRPVAGRAAATKVPCWVFKNCDEAKRAACPAYRTPSLACWVALMRAEGQLPARCAGCQRYDGMPAFAGD